MNKTELERYGYRVDTDTVYSQHFEREVAVYRWVNQVINFSTPRGVNLTHTRKEVAMHCKSILRMDVNELYEIGINVVQRVVTGITAEALMFETHEQALLYANYIARDIPKPKPIPTAWRWVSLTPVPTPKEPKEPDTSSIYLEQ